jgi:hypothetical protein
MNVDFEIAKLKTKDDWGALAELLGGPQSRVAQNIIRHLITIRVSSYLLETRYITQPTIAHFMHKRLRPTIAIARGFIFLPRT